MTAKKILPISRASFSYSYLRLLTISLYAWKNSRSFVFFGKHLTVPLETSTEHYRTRQWQWTKPSANVPFQPNIGKVSNECRSLIEVGIKMIDDFRSCISRSSQSKQIDSPKQWKWRHYLVVIVVCFKISEYIENLAPCGFCSGNNRLNFFLF